MKNLLLLFAAAAACAGCASTAGKTEKRQNAMKALSEKARESVAEHSRRPARLEVSGKNNTEKCRRIVKAYNRAFEADERFKRSVYEINDNFLAALLWRVEGRKKGGDIAALSRQRGPLGEHLERVRGKGERIYPMNRQVLQTPLDGHLMNMSAAWRQRAGAIAYANTLMTAFSECFQLTDRKHWEPEFY